MTFQYWNLSFTNVQNVWFKTNKLLDQPKSEEEYETWVSYLSLGPKYIWARTKKYCACPNFFRLVKKWLQYWRNPYPLKKFIGFLGYLITPKFFFWDLLTFTKSYKKIGKCDFVMLLKCSGYLVVMSPSKAGSSWSSSWRIFSSARLVSFFPSARNRKSAENEPKLSFFFLIYVAKSYFLTS